MMTMTMMNIVMIVMIIEENWDDDEMRFYTGGRA